MGLESATYVSQLNALNPVGATDPKSQGDDHLRLIKSVLQASFPNISGAMTVSHTALNALNALGITGFAAPSSDVDIAAETAGVATTIMRSDAKMQLSQSISPNWTGTHTWRGTVARGGTTGQASLGMASGSPLLELTNASGPANQKTNEIYTDPSGSLVIQTLDDGVTATRSILLVTRSALAVLAFSFGNATDNPTYTFLGNGLFTINGTFRTAGSGSAGTPALAIGASNTGIFSSTAGRVNISCAGVDTASVDSVRFGSGVPFQGPAGAVGAPTFSFLGSTNDGVYSGGAGNIRVATGGIKAFEIDNSQNLFDKNGFRLGYLELPQNAQTVNYTCVLADSGKHIYHASGAGAGDVYTIPANASVAYPIGTVLTFVNEDSNSVSIAITTDTMTLAGSALTGTRTLAANSIATALKTTATRWLISGPGVS